MVIYEPRKRGWLERIVKVSAEQLEKLFITAVLTNAYVEIENDEEAENLRRLLPWLDPAFRREAQMVLSAYETTKEILSELGL